MLEIQRIFDRFRRQIAIVLLFALVWIISLPTASVQANGYFSEKPRQVEATKPYFSVKNRIIAENEHFKPYYATKEHLKEKVIRNQPETSDRIENGRRVKEAIPRDLDSNRH
jgi:hypothetical protein